MIVKPQIQQLPEGVLIVNALHVRPVLARALPWYRVRSLRRIAARARRRQQARQPSPSAPQEAGAAEVAATAPRA